LKELEIVAEEFGLKFIEDAAQALGSKLENRACGSYGDAAILSFNNNKIVTGHGGGALLTGNKEIADRAKHLSNTARISHPWEVEHTETGYNYRMSSVTAALVCAQLERLDEFLGAKQFLLSRYENSLKNVLGVFHVNDSPPVGEGELLLNNWLISIVVDPSIKEELLSKLHERKIQARALFTPLHRLFCYCPHKDPMTLTDYWFDRVVCLPSGVVLA
jgi:perosamine synthetase